MRLRLYEIVFRVDIEQADLPENSSYGEIAEDDDNAGYLALDTLRDLLTMGDEPWGKLAHEIREVYE